MQTAERERVTQPRLATLAVVTVLTGLVNESLRTWSHEAPQSLGIAAEQR